MLEKRELGNTGIAVSRTGMGCVTFGREIDEATSFQVADRAFERGITLFDTADCYSEGASERILGKWIKDRGVRDDVVVMTKVGGPMSDDPADRGCSARHIEKSLEESLRRLQLDCVDCYLVHCWDPDVHPLETLKALDKGVRQGKVRTIGCSHYAAWQLCRMLWLADVNDHDLTPMKFVQPGYSLVAREIENEMIPLCADRNIGIISYSPLAAGFLTGKYRKGGETPIGSRFQVRPSHQDVYFSDLSFRVLEVLRKKADEMNAPMMHLALAWVAAQPAITSMLIGARNVEQVDQAFDALELSLDEGFRNELDAQMREIT